MPGSQTRESDLTTFTILVEGEPLPDTFSIVAIDIRKEINRIPAASVILYDGDAARQEFETSSSDVLIPGKTIEIKGGYKLEETLLFKGVITGQRIQSRRRGESKLYIDARDAARGHDAANARHGGERPGCNESTGHHGSQAVRAVL